MSKPRIHSATTYKLYIVSCVIASSGLVLLFKFPEVHSLEPGIDPQSLTVNRDWIKRIGSRKLNLNVAVGLLIGVLILLAGLIAPSA